MRLVRYGKWGAEKPGLLDASGHIRDIAGFVGDVRGDNLFPRDLERLAKLACGNLPLIPAGVRLGVPLAGIGKIVGVGLNYRDHAKEVGLPLPSEPTLFLKATSSLCGAGDDLIIPRDGHCVDWEVELAVVIGVPGVYIKESAASGHIAGYCIGIDFSERHFQFDRGGQGFKGKSADSFCPLGPWLVTTDDVANPHSLPMTLSVNGIARQNGTTRDMIFSAAELVSYVSRFMSLQGGDVILTGTPAGVGMGRSPRTYLRAGDEIIATIDGLGRQVHRAVDAL